MTYDSFPCYPVAGGKVESGSDALAAWVVGVGSLVLHDVAPRTVAAGSPATPRRVIPHSEGTGT